MGVFLYGLGGGMLSDEKMEEYCRSVWFYLEGVGRRLGRQLGVEE